MDSVRTLVCVAVALCGGVAVAAPSAEYRAGNVAAMREAAKAVPVAVTASCVAPVTASAAPAEAADVPAVRASLAKAASATNGAAVVARITGEAAETDVRTPVFPRLDCGAALTAYSYVFAPQEDVPLLFPGIAARRAAPDSYFGYLERRIAAACAAGDLQTAGELVERYVNEWDNVYKVHPRQGRLPEASAR